MRKIKIVYFGTPEFSAYILEKLIEFCPIQIVITRPDKAKGRKQILTESAVALMSHQHNISVLKPVKLDQEFIENHKDLIDCDIFIVASYGKIIPQSLLDIPKLGALNVHPSLLPKYRGPSPILTPILNGDKKTGVSIMLMDAEMDHGPILNTIEVSISKQYNHQTLTTKLAQTSAPLLIDTLTKFIEGRLKPKPQNHSKATFTKMIKKEDGYFDIDNPPSPTVLDRMIRAYYPWPNTWTKWKGKIIKFLPDRKIQMEGKNPISIRDFLNGYPEMKEVLQKLFP